MGRDASGATVNFGRAKELFAAGQYEDSMRLLLDLDRQYPSTRNILLAMATCLEKLECPGEAEQICDRLLALGPDPRAAEMKARINAARNAANVGGIYGPIDLDMALRASAPRPPAAPIAQSTDRRRLFLIGGVVLIAVLLLAIPLFMKRQPPSAPAAVQHAQSAAAQPTPEQIDNTRRDAHPILPPAVNWILVVLVSYGLAVLVLYPCLRFTGRLREESFGGNLQDLAITVMFMFLWGLIPIVGGILAAVHFMRHYELGCLETLGILFVAWILEVLVIVFVIMPLLFGTAHVIMQSAV